MVYTNGIIVSRTWLYAIKIKHVITYVIRFLDFSSSGTKVTIWIVTNFRYGKMSGDVNADMYKEKKTNSVISDEVKIVQSTFSSVLS